MKARNPLLWHLSPGMCGSKTSHWGRIGSTSITANGVIFHKTRFKLLFRDLQTAWNSCCHCRISLGVSFSDALKHLHLPLIVLQARLRPVWGAAVADVCVSAQQRRSRGRNSQGSLGSALRLNLKKRLCRCSSCDLPPLYFDQQNIGCALVCGLFRSWHMEWSAGVQLCFLQKLAEALLNSWDGSSQGQGIVSARFINACFYKPVSKQPWFCFSKGQRCS